jgi:hypothetical protein
MKNVRNSVRNYSGLGSKLMRSLAGNYSESESFYKPTFKEPIRHHMKTLLVWLRNKKRNIPTVYKGLRSHNKNVFLKTGKFSTRAPTSTSLSRNVALNFTNRNKVVLLIPQGKYHARKLGNYSVKPNEKEILFPPGTFTKRGRTKNGNYIVNFVERERSLPRRFFNI